MRGIRQITPGPAQRAARERAEAREEREEARRALRAASMLGVCSYCGVNVTPDGFHAWNCVRVPTERRANRGRQP